MGSKAKLGEITSVIKEAVKPKEGISYWHYSLPAFDNGKTPDKVDGSEVRSNKLAVYPNTILMNKLNVRFKRIWPIVDYRENSIASTEFIPLKPERVDYWYLYYQLCSPALTSELESMRTGTSNSHQRIDQAAFLDCEINLPCLPIQQRIGAFLHALDAKIALNNRINDYLAA